MKIRQLVLSAMFISPMAGMADGYHHQREYTTQRTCFKEIYREEYVAGNRGSKGCVKSYLDKVAVSCSSLSWNLPGGRFRHPNNHTHYFPHTYRKHNRPNQEQILISRRYQTSGESCSSGNATKGGLIGGVFAAAISKEDAYAWSIPFPLVADLDMGIANAEC